MSKHDSKGRAIDIVGIGLGFDDITEKQRGIITKAEVLVGGNRHLSYFKEQGLSCETLAITKDIPEIIKSIKARKDRSRIVVLASGDPLFNGIGSTLIAALGKDAVRIHPNISSVAGAFAAIKEPWHDAVLLSLHGKNIDDLATVIRKHDKIAILTDNKKTPAWLAQFLIENRISNKRMYICENLGNQNEAVKVFDDFELASKQLFSSPNIVIITVPHDRHSCHSKTYQTDMDMGNFKNSRSATEQVTAIPADQMDRDNSGKTGLSNIELKRRATSHSPIYPGMPECKFFHQNGLITKAEVRAVSLSKLKLVSNNHTFWDLGAGSGSVSIEASRFIPDGRLFAVEKHAHRISDIQKNIDKFNIANMEVVEAELPMGLNDLPDPDRIFIGGGGAHVADIVQKAGDRLVAEGIMVVNTVLIQSMNLALEAMKEMGFETDLIQMQVSVSKKMPFGERLDALNPVWIITGKKPTQ